MGLWFRWRGQRWLRWEWRKRGRRIQRLIKILMLLPLYDPVLQVTTAKTELKRAKRKSVMTKENIVDLSILTVFFVRLLPFISSLRKKMTRTNGETELAVRRVKSYLVSSAVLLVLVCYKRFSKSASCFLKVIFWEDGIIANWSKASKMIFRLPLSVLEAIYVLLERWNYAFFFLRLLLSDPDVH